MYKRLKKHKIFCITLISMSLFLLSCTNWQVLDGGLFSSTGLGIFNLTAAGGYGNVILSWNNPTNSEFVSVRIQGSTNDYPIDENDGTTIYEGIGTSYLHSGLINNIGYYYSVFSYNGTAYSDRVSISATPSGNKWFTDFQEYASNPIVSHATEDRYYACVLYDANAFRNTIGEDIDGAGTGTDTYTVTPYYKMWVANGSHTFYYYSDDGLTWINPPVGINIILQHSHPSVIYNPEGAYKYKMWNWNTTNSSSGYLDHYESTNGVAWTKIPAGTIQPNNHQGPAFDNPSVAVYNIQVMYLNNRYYGWIDNNGRRYVMTTTTPEVGTSWTNIGKCLLNGADFVTDGCSWITYRNGKFEMWYPSDPAGVFVGYRRAGLSYCESTDGFNFTGVDYIPYKGLKAFSNPSNLTNSILTITDGVLWRTKLNYAPCVIFDANKFSGQGEARHYKIYFAGEATNGVARGIGYASFNKPVGE